MSLTTSVLPNADTESPLRESLERFAPIGLDALNACARLQTRKDRKYLLNAEGLRAILAALPADSMRLEIDGQTGFSYQSIYFDTEEFASYRTAALRRPDRFKVRARSYLESGLCVAEVKTKNRRGRTVKRRRELIGEGIEIADAVRAFASGQPETTKYAHQLLPVLASRYQRTTLVLPAGSVRMTIDSSYQCTDFRGASTGLDNTFIVETKTNGKPSAVDRILWAGHHRPVKISKYATGLAALHPELPSNRWSPVLQRHFGRELPIEVLHSRTSKES